MKKLFILLFATVLFVSAHSVFADECIHSWVDNVYEAPTAFEEGFTYRRCSLCGIEERTTIPVRSMTKSEKAAMKATKQFIKAIKKYDAKKLMKSFVIAPKGKIFVDNKYTAAVIRKINRKVIKYNIFEVSVSGKTAKVKLEIQYADASIAFFNGFSDLTQALYGNPSLINTSNQQRLAAFFTSRLKKDRYEKEWEPITLKFKKTSNGWKIDKMSNALARVINCNYQKAYKEFFSD